MVQSVPVAGFYLQAGHHESEKAALSLTALVPFHHTEH